MKIVAVDPSGNWGDKEGWGTTGLAFYHADGVIELDDIKSKDYNTPQEYWHDVVSQILVFEPDWVVCEGYRLYHHKGQTADAQANSEMPTCKLIGVMEYQFWNEEVSYHKQFASDVKSRWADKVLESVGLLQKIGGKTYFRGKVTNTHKRDALRHLCHFKKYFIDAGKAEARI